MLERIPKPKLGVLFFCTSLQAVELVAGEDNVSWSAAVPISEQAAGCTPLSLSAEDTGQGMMSFMCGLSSQEQRALKGLAKT